MKRLSHRIKIKLWNAIFRLPAPVTKKLLQSNLLMILVAKGRFAINNLDSKLQPYIASLPGKFFIEIGGNDGISQSNTKRLEMFMDWRGILVEPFFENYSRILLSRSPVTVAIHAACVPHSFEGSSVELIYGDLMTFASELHRDEMDDVAHLKSAEEFARIGQVGQPFRAPALTLDAILNDADAPKRIDFFSLDVEGAELEVLKGVTHDEYRFSYLLVESRNFEGLSEYLGRHGYEFLDALTAHDFLFRDASLGSMR